MENTNPNIARVQHVAKSSSDQLLRKFAQVGSDPKDKTSAKELRLAKRVKRKQASSTTAITGVAERNSLLPSAAAASHKPMALMVRRLGMGRARTRARELKNKSLITAIEKVNQDDLV